MRYNNVGASKMPGATERSDAKVEPEPKANVIKYQKPKSNKQIKRTKKENDSKQGTNGKEKRNKLKPAYVPDTNFTLACLVSLCFNLPLGFVAIFLSLSAARAYRDGDPVLGEKRAKFSVLLSLFSIVSTVLIVMSIVLWIVVENQSNRELHDADT